MKHTFQGTVDSDANEHNLYYTHIKVPDDILAEYKAAKISRVVFQLNGQSVNHGAFIPMGNGTYFLITSKQLLKDNKIAIGDIVTIDLRPDTSKYGMAICQEMNELLDQDPEGSELFHALTDGKIRSLLYKANGYKSSDKRLEKSVIILEHLKANNGTLDWKMLNEAFKQGL